MIVDKTWQKLLELWAKNVTRLPNGNHVAYSSVKEYYQY